jgi:putative aldouronate transport system permease protein
MNLKPVQERGMEKSKKNLLGFSTIIAIPSLILFFFFSIIPFLKSLIIAFKNYSPVYGIVNSPWVGLKNFQSFFMSIHSIRIIRNTLFISILSIVLGGIYVFLLTYGIASVKNKWVKSFVTSLVILPALIPVSILLGAIIKTGLLVESSYYRFFAIGYEVFCISPIAILAGMFLCINKFNIKRIKFITLGYMIIRFMLLFSTDLNYILSSYNPLTYEVADVLGTYTFRTGIMNGDFSAASANYIIKTLFQLIPVIIGIITIIFMSGRIEEQTRESHEFTKVTNLGASFLAITIVPAIIFILVLTTTIPGVNAFNNQVMRDSLTNSFIISILSSTLFIILSVLLAYALSLNNRIILIITSIVLLFGGNTIGQYIHMRSLGLFNTNISIIIINGLYASMGAFFIYFAIVANKKYDFKEFFKESLPVLIALFGVGFAKFYGNIKEPLVYMTDRRFFPISLILREVLLMGGNPESEGILISTLGLFLIPAILGILCLWIGVGVISKKNTW